ncbi:formate transporter FocA [Brachybacterium aquaticum]|uniref:Formate transporter n=1 Tax=Brachybacterium aquaticum TaxID=1432564 RepID=A0A841AH11_9MICO|nr:formate transporter FocA [Brachybacterium aquaticum]MBB5832328.1 formate transporter [Brachybacterium aquaticum]
MNASSPDPKTAAAATPPSTVALAPKQLAQTLEDGMYAKATAPLGRMFLQTLSGGAFIALGFVFMVTSQQGMGDWPIGIAKLLGGAVFSVGLGLVVISGSDLFTGTTMTLVPRLSKRITTGQMLKHWGISAGGNFLGALGVALLILFAGTHATNGSAWGLVVLNSTQAKLSYDWHQAFFLGILANFAVCLAVWAATAGKTVADKILAVAGPVALFVSTGFEHSVANMFMLPMGLLIKYTAGDAFWQGEAMRAAGKSVEDYASITVGSALWDNLIPVLLGNIVGGAVLVGAYFWSVYRRGDADLAKG